MCLLLPRAAGGNWRRLLSGSVHANHARLRSAVVTRSQSYVGYAPQVLIIVPRYFSNIFFD